jgi:two-component system chemotaxis response regulator CheB
VRVVIVDDSVVIRRLVADALAGHAQVVATLSSGDALIEWAAANPTGTDAVVLDLEMPGTPGLQTVAKLRAGGYTTPVVVFSTLATDDERARLRAAGASGSVRKPANVGSVLETQRALADELVPLLERLVREHGTATPRATAPQAKPAPSSPSRPAAPSAPAPRPAPRQPAHPAAPPRPAPPTARTGRRMHALVIGSSTGGPDALARFFTSLGSVDVPVLVAQHMPADFTQMLAQRLGRISPMPVHHAEDGTVVLPGNVYVAPGARHLRVVRSGTDVVCRLSEQPASIVKPSADELFDSATAVWQTVLAVVLTGMGRDGLVGAGRIKAAGGEVLAQDEATSVVWGMPKAVADANLAEVLPLDEIAPMVAARLRRKP